MTRAATAKTIETRAKQVIVDTLCVDEEEIKATSSFVDDLGADSLDQVELIMGIEQEFDLEISDEAADGVKTFGELLAYLGKHRVDKLPGAGV